MGSRDKVLIVDDSELDRIALKKMLKDAYEIVEAVDGAGALRILESQKEFDAISAIILDLVMPQMDGFEFLREYRKVDSYRRIPVIVASVERDVKTEKACLALGARDFIGKPYDPQIVRFRVENAVRSSEQQLSRELRYRADYDMLTGIYNKTHFFEATRVLLKRHPEETYAFLRLDIEKVPTGEFLLRKQQRRRTFTVYREGDPEICGRYGTDCLRKNRGGHFRHLHAVQGRGGDVRACALHAHASWTVPARF